MMMFWIKKIHKWASLLIGLQVLIWIISGLVFNVIDHDKARGNTYKQATETTTVAPLLMSEMNLIPVETILNTYPDVIELKSIQLLSSPFYLLTKEQGLYRHFANSYQLVNAVTGELTVIDESFALSIAKASYNGPGNVSSVTLLSKNILLTENIADFPKQKNPSWQVNFDDELSTSVYVEQGSGRLIDHSNSDKRFADFFFMLHFMDYGKAGNFNNLQIILFAFVTLWLTLSGFICSARANILINVGLKNRVNLS